MFLCCAVDAQFLNETVCKFRGVIIAKALKPFAQHRSSLLSFSSWNQPPFRGLSKTHFTQYVARQLFGCGYSRGFGSGKPLLKSFDVWSTGLIITEGFMSCGRGTGNCNRVLQQWFPNVFNSCIRCTCFINTTCHLHLN